MSSRGVHRHALDVAAQDQPDLAGRFGVADPDLQRFPAESLGQGRGRQVALERVTRGDQRGVLVAARVRVHVDAARPGLHRSPDRRSLNRVLEVGPGRDRGGLIVDREENVLRLPPVGPVEAQADAGRRRHTALHSGGHIDGRARSGVAAQPADQLRNVYVSLTSLERDRVGRAVLFCMHVRNATKQRP